MNAITGRQSLKLTRQSTHIVLKALLHIVHSAHDWIMHNILNVSAEINKLKLHSIKLSINNSESIVQSRILAIKVNFHSIKMAIHMCHHALKPSIHMSLEPMLHLLKIRIKVIGGGLPVLSLLMKWWRRHLLSWICLRLSGIVICRDSLIIRKGGERPGEKTNPILERPKWSVSYLTLTLKSGFGLDQSHNIRSVG